MNHRNEMPKQGGGLAALRFYTDMFVTHWVTIVSLAVAGCVVTLVVSTQLAPKYQASSTLYISIRTNQSVETADLLQGSNFTRDSMVSFMDLATTSIVIDRVAEDLELAPDSLTDMLEVESPVDSVLLKFVSTAGEPEMAAAVANSAADVFIKVIQEELEIAPDGQGNPIQVRVVDAAAVPTEAASPHLLSNSVLGFLGGLFIGIGIAAIRGMLDTRIQSAQELEEHSKYPVLGRIPFDAQIRQQPLIIHTDPPGPRFDAFRMLRTNLQFLQPGSHSNTLMVSSAAPGEGKTHVAANLAVVLAVSGARVVLIEADLRSPRLSSVMGIEGGGGLTDVLIHRVTLDEVLQPWGTYNLTVLPAGQIPPNPSELLGSASMRTVLKELESGADYVLIDAPPLLPVTDAAVISKLVSGTLLVAAVSQTKQQELAQAITILETINSPLLGIVLNKDQPRIPVQYYRDAAESTRGPVGSTS